MLEMVLAPYRHTHEEQGSPTSVFDSVRRTTNIKGCPLPFRVNNVRLSVRVSSTDSYTTIDKSRPAVFVLLSLCPTVDFRKQVSRAQPELIEISVISSINKKYCCSVSELN